ncbi:hypothetical protein J6590_093561 [Homalodisca vitripennis]|nr:hypothetical protein J6590_093561 [Homalodisca vitripennis]
MATFKQFKVTRETVVQLWTKMGKSPSTNLQPHFIKVKLVTLPSVAANDLSTTAQPFCQVPWLPLEHKEKGSETKLIDQSLEH